MAGKNMSVYGVCPSRASAESAVETFRVAGFPSTDVSLLCPEIEGPRELAHKKVSKAPEGAAAGVSAGALFGGTFGWLAGIGLISIPGFGPFIAAGPIMSVLAGLGVGGAAGGVVGALIGFGLPEYEAIRFAGRIKKGGILISVHCDQAERVDRARTILKQLGAEDISCATEGAADTAAPRTLYTSN